MQLKLFQERNQISALERKRKAEMPQIFEKIMGVMLSRCYKSLPIEAARQFVEMLSKNNTKMDVSAYVPINFGYYDNPAADLRLSHEEIFVSKLINAVPFLVSRCVHPSQKKLDCGWTGAGQEE